VAAPTQLSLAIQSDSDESTDDSKEREDSITSHLPPVQSSQRQVSRPPSVRSSSTVPVQTSRRVSRPPSIRSSSTVPVQTSRRVISKKRHTVPQRPGPYKIGEQLIITNNYLNARGTEGVVLSSKGRYTVIQDDEGVLHTRAHSNYNKVIN